MVEQKVMYLRLTVGCLRSLKIWDSQWPEQLGVCIILVLYKTTSKLIPDSCHGSTMFCLSSSPGNSSLEAAVNWIVDHENDSQFDKTPVVCLHLHLFLHSFHRIFDRGVFFLQKLLRLEQMN